MTLAEQLTQAREYASQAYSYFKQAAIIENKVEDKSPWIKTLSNIGSGIVAIGVFALFVPQAANNVMALIATSVVTFFISKLILKIIGKIVDKKRMEQVRSINRIGYSILDDATRQTGVPQYAIYPIGVDYMIKVYNARRASTLPEALSLLEEQEHRWRMEDSMNSAVQMAKEIATHCSVIEFKMDQVSNAIEAQTEELKKYNNNNYYNND